MPHGGGGEGLSRLARVVASSPMKQTRLIVASDVTNPLVGPTGAAAIFGPQKGATPDMVTLLEKGLERLADITLQATGVRLHDMPAQAPPAESEARPSRGWGDTWSRGLNSSWTWRTLISGLWDVTCS